MRPNDSVDQAHSVELDNEEDELAQESNGIIDRGNNYSEPLGQDELVTMKKSKKFIKFKDFIIKLPNSQGLQGIRNFGSASFTQNQGGDLEDLESMSGQGHFV